MQQTAKKFKNFSAEDFAWKHDGILYNFKAGQEMYLESDKADHFAKHLVDREINRKNVENGLHATKNELSTRSAAERAPLEALCFPSDEEVTPTVALDKNEKAKRKEKKVEEFADLKH